MSSMSRNVKLVRALSATNVVLGVMSAILGVVSMQAAPFHDGVFGMGIWIGAWILITGVAGYCSAKLPDNYFRVGVFLGCCLVCMVTVAICCIVLGTAVISHYRFEMTVTREYYKGRPGSWGVPQHEDYWKPQKYFDDRNWQGTVGCVVYGSLVAIIAVNFLVCCGCCYACRDMCYDTTQAQPRSYNIQRIRSTQIQQQQQQQQQWNELHTSVTSPQIVSTFPEPGEFYHPFKLPNYAEVFPEGFQGETTSPDPVPPPAYSPSSDQRGTPAYVVARVLLPTMRCETTDTTTATDNTSARIGPETVEAGPDVHSVEHSSRTLTLSE